MGSAFDHSPSITVPSSSTNNRIVTWNGSTGKNFNNTALVEIAAGVVTGITSLSVDNIQILDNAIVSTNSNGNIGLTPNGSGAVVISKLQVTSGGAQDGYVLTSTDGNGNVAWEEAGGGAISAVTNGSSDRIATFTSTTALNGEANLTFDGQNLYLINSTTDSSSNLMVNSSATSGTTHARLILRVASGNAGDAFISFHDQGGAEWAFGLDNSDSGKLKLGYGGTVETDTVLAIDTNGQVQIREIIADGSGQQTNYTSVQKGLAKAWGNATSNGSLESGSHNVSSYSRTSAGNYRVTYSTAMEGGNYSAFSAALMDDHLSQPYLRSATTVDITVRNNSHGSDDEGNCFVIFGELS